jgi:hypothetical protein
LGTATATDACSTPTITTSNGSQTGGCSKSQTRTFTARDACNNTATVSRTVTWKTSPSVTILPESQSKPYGAAIDPVTITANDANSSGSNLTIQSISYKRNNGPSVNGLPGNLALTEGITGANSHTWMVTGCIKEDIGTYVVKVVVSNECGVTAYDEFTIIVTSGIVQPIADAFYTGPCFFWTTGPSSSTTTLTLAATIKNQLNACGDIRTARVSFYVRNGTTLTPITGAQNLPVGLVNPGDLNVGSASANVQYNIGNTTAAILDIAVKITGNYNNNINDPSTDKAIMVAVPVPGGQICGGGNLDNSGSAGYIAGASDEVTNFTFFVKYNNSLTNAQGGVEIKVISRNNSSGIDDGIKHTYRIKSNAISTLAVSAPNAQFSSKCNVAEIVNGNEISIQGNCIMQLDLFDGVYSSPAKPDSLGITIYKNGGGIWFSSKWNGTKTVRKAINNDGGNISVTGGGPGTQKTTNVDAEITKDKPEDLLVPFNVKAFPNPTEHQFTLYLEGASNEKVQVVVYDAVGRQVKKIERGDASGAIKFGEELKAGVYIVEVRQGVNRKTLKLIKQ